MSYTASICKTYDIMSHCKPIPGNTGCSQAKMMDICEQTVFFSSTFLRETESNSMLLDLPIVKSEVTGISLCEDSTQNHLASRIIRFRYHITRVSLILFFTISVCMSLFGHESRWLPQNVFTDASGGRWYFVFLLWGKTRNCPETIWKTDYRNVLY